jgi:hypothetical protein
MSPKNIWRVTPDALYFWHQVERQPYSGFVVLFAKKGRLCPRHSDLSTLAYATRNGNVSVCEGNIEIQLIEG